MGPLRRSTNCWWFSPLLFIINVPYIYCDFFGVLFGLTACQRSVVPFILFIASYPLVGGVIFQMYYGPIESKLLIILTKHISSERSESQYSIFGGYFVIGVTLRERNLYIFDRKMHNFL